MKRFACSLTLLIGLVALAGCQSYHVQPGACRSIYGGMCRNGGPAASPDYVPPLPMGTAYAEPMGPPGPPTGAYAYPYYTVRGPRDFLLNDPPTIGR